MVGIYIITNNINGMSYIGKSVCIEERFREHRRHHKSNIRLSRSIDKYGLENFSFMVLEECSREELSDKEKYWIDSYDDDMLYNFASGGNGGDTITKLPKDKYNEYISKLSKPRSEKFRKEQSKRFLGSKNPMYGKNISEETRDKHRKACIGRIWINNGIENKFVYPDDYESNYDNNVWNKGMLPKRSATTIES